MEQGPDFRHYESFVAVAEECSFRKAAEKLHITQPALSGHIKVLEEWLGQNVFRRAPSGSEMTEAGRNLLVYAIRACADDVVEQALAYVFSKDRDFQDFLKTPEARKVAATLRIRKVTGA